MELNGDCIVAVVEMGLLYRNEDGQLQWLDFPLCNRNWRKTLRQPFMPEFDSYCVARHSLHSPRQMFIEFFARPFVRFNFADAAALQHLLMRMAQAGGWTSYDLS